MSHLMAVGEVADPGGMASTVLAESVGYPGSSVAFAQLLSGMERSGLIEREIRGKRTYRIVPAPAAAAELPGHDGAGGGIRAGDGGVAESGGAEDSGRYRAGDGGPGGSPGLEDRGDRGRAAARDRDGSAAAGGALVSAGPGELDYDELARRLLVQVVHRLAAVPEPGVTEAAAWVGNAEAQGRGTGAGGGDTGLRQTVASLEQKLASAQSRQRRLTAENAKLREQLRAAQQSLAQAQERAPAGGHLDTAEVRLLERLLSPLRAPRSGREEAGTG